MFMRCERVPVPAGRQVFRGRVGILIPAYNEAAHLGELLASCAGVRPAVVLVVDDASTDQTPQVLAKLRSRPPAGLRLETIRAGGNLGKQGAVRLGLRALAGRRLDALALVDGDGQHDPAELPGLADLLQRFDMVIGARRTEHMPPHRRLSNWLANRGFEWLGGLDFVDVQSGLRLYRRWLVEVLADRLPPRGGYALEHESLTVLARHARDNRAPIRVAAAEVGCRYGPDTSSMRPRHVLDLTVQTVRQALRFRAASRPLDPRRDRLARGRFEEFVLRGAEWR